MLSGSYHQRGIHTLMHALFKSIWGINLSGRSEFIKIFVMYISISCLMNGFVIRDENCTAKNVIVLLRICFGTCRAAFMHSTWLLYLLTYFLLCLMERLVFINIFVACLAIGAVTCFVICQGTGIEELSMMFFTVSGNMCLLVDLCLSDVTFTGFRKDEAARELGTQIHFLKVFRWYIYIFMSLCKNCVNVYKHLTNMKLVIDVKINFCFCITLFMNKEVMSTLKFITTYKLMTTFKFVANFRPEYNLKFYKNFKKNIVKNFNSNFEIFLTKSFKKIIYPKCNKSIDAIFDKVNSNYNKKLNFDKLNVYDQDFHRKTSIKMFKTYFINKYLRSYVEFYFLSQTISSSNHCKIRFIFCFTCNKSNKFYITTSRYFFIDKLFKNAFSGCDNYILLLATIHVRSRIKFELLINSLHLENALNRTLNLFFLTPFLDTVSHKPLNYCFTIYNTYCNLHDKYEKHYVYENNLVFLYHA